MMEAKSDRALLSEAVSRVVDKFAKRHPTMNVFEACASLGVVAGTLAAVNIPPGNPEADAMLAQIMGRGFGDAMIVTRGMKAS